MSSLVGRGPTGMTQGLNKTGYRHAQLANFSPEQMNLFSQLFSQVGPESFTGRLARGDEGTFQQMEAPALRQFGELQGNIASRFSGMGSGARKSSGFQNVIGGAASDLAERLAGQRSGLQRQAIQDLMGMGNTLLSQKPFENFLVQKQKPFWQELLMGLSPIAAQVGGQLGTQAMAGSQQKSQMDMMMKMLPMLMAL